MISFHALQEPVLVTGRGKPCAAEINGAKVIFAVKPAETQVQSQTTWSLVVCSRSHARCSGQGPVDQKFVFTVFPLSMLTQ